LPNVRAHPGGGRQGGSGTKLSNWDYITSIADALGGWRAC